MAAKKKHHKKKVGTHRRRHRVSGAKEIEKGIIRLAGVGAGAVGGAFLISMGSTAIPSLPAWAVPAGVAAVGFVLPYMAKHDVVQAVGDGLLAIGAVETANQTFLSVPGISGMAMSNNSEVGTSNISKALGASRMNGPQAYINRTVGMSKYEAKKVRAVGALICD